MNVVKKTEHPEVDSANKPEDHLMDLLGIVALTLAKRANESPMTEEKAEDISRRST